MSHPRPKPARRRAILRSACALATALVLAGQAHADSFPRLLPLEELLPDAAAPEHRLTPDGATPLLERATRLRARAAILRTRDPIDPETRARIAARFQTAPD